MGILKMITVSNKGLRHKILLAFSLMSIIPLLACVYIIVNYLFPQLKDISDISLIVLASVLVAMLGLMFAKKLVDPVVNMALEARMIASGDFDRRVPVSSDDEVGNLGQSINAMTQRIKSNLDELKNYGQRMREINVDVHKKVLALSSLLQIGDIISAGSIKIEPLLELIVEKASAIFDSGFGLLYAPKEDGADFLPKVAYNVNSDRISELVIKPGGRNFSDRLLETQAMTILDRSLRLNKEQESFLASYNLNNFLAIPMHSGRKNLGILVICSRADDFKFKPDDIDLVKVFAKQMTIAIESDMLTKKTEELAIKDELTDLYNKNFILQRLDEEIRRAVFYQRPCSFILLNIDDFKKFRDTNGELVAEELLKRFARLIKENSTPVGKVARVGGDEFAMVLPEKNKKEAVYIAEEIRKKVESVNLLKDVKAAITVSIGVSENPIDGATGDELFRRAQEALSEAKTTGKNKVIS